MPSYRKRRCTELCTTGQARLYFKEVTNLFTLTNFLFVNLLAIYSRAIECSHVEPTNNRNLKEENELSISHSASNFLHFLLFLYH